jgi:hypothetical protein
MNAAIIFFFFSAVERMGLEAPESYAGRMKSKKNDDPFVHVLLFECVDCSCPVPLAVTSDARNIEDVDVRTLKLQCHNCGWSGASEGLGARRHWVDEWKPWRENDASKEASKRRIRRNL